MEFQVQGSVLVNGEWVSRTADVYQIMARNQQQEDAEMQEPESNLRAPVPELGILSRTVIQSSFNRLVLPANIRHKELNDVLFVGEDFVQLKEICDYGHLRHIASKSDFKGKILAARVFGEPRKVQVNTSEPSPLLRHASVHRHKRSETGDEQVSLPPEVIVLTLSSRTLMFLWAKNTRNEFVTFHHRSIRLPSGSSRFDRPGPFLAVDPTCGAIAVAAHEGSFVIYKTRAVDQWREQTHAENGQVPIEDEIPMPIEGRVMHMEFLSSGATEDDSHVILLFILVQDGKTKVACYDWDFRIGLDASSPRKDRVHVDFEDRTPSLLIPLSRSADFLLVCDRHISLYRHILSGRPSRETCAIPDYIMAPLRPGASKSAPRWVQWSRAPRNPDFAKEAFYIAREDGMVAYVERGQSGTLEISEAGSWPYPIDTAFACLSVDNSEFAQSYPDVLISGGVGSDGHLCRVGAWPNEYAYTLPASESHVFSALESIPNWTPLTDMAVSRLPGPQSPDARYRAAIYVASGESPHGQVSELRHGLKALVEESFEAMTGCTGVYILDHGSGALRHEGLETRQHYVTFVIALPSESLVIRASRTLFDGSLTQDEPSLAWDGGTWEMTELPLDGEDTVMAAIQDEETLSACAWNDGTTIQITRTTAKILHRPSLVEMVSLTFPHMLLQAVVVLGSKTLAVTFRKDNQAVLKLLSISSDGRFLGLQPQANEHSLPCDPTCLETMEYGGVAHVLVGTIDSQIHLFTIQSHENGDQSLALSASTRLANNTADEVAMVCESAVMLTTRTGPQLVCGTRDGYAISMYLDRQQENYTITSKSAIRMGSTAVLISPCATDRSSAFVACGPDFCRLRATSRDHTPIDIDSVWLVDPRNPAYIQGPLAAIAQLPFSAGTDTLGRDLGGFMLAVLGKKMVFAQLDSDRSWSGHDSPLPIFEKGKVVPRSLSTSSTPKRLADLAQYKADQHKMAVATIELKEERPSPNGYRMMHSSIKLVCLDDDPAAEEAGVKDESEASSASRKIITADFPLEHYERVYSMIEWTYVKDDGHKYHFIIVGTGIMEGPGRESGRRLFFKAGRSELKLQKKSVYKDGPVRCLAMYDKNRLLTIFGTTLQVDDYNPALTRWEKKGATELPSPGAHMTVHDSSIFVSTSHDSHICYNLVPLPIVQGQPEVKFEQVYSDARQRHTTHHLVYDLPNLPNTSPPDLRDGTQDRLGSNHDTVVLLADKTCSLTGLLHIPSAPHHRSTTSTLFEACLPRSVIRIHRGDIRPPWRRPDSSSYSNTPYPNIPGVLADDILGACSDGTIYSFTIVSQTARRILRLIQNLIEEKQRRDPALKYSIIAHRNPDMHLSRILQNGAEGVQDGNIKARDVDPEVMEVGDAAARFNAIDGDLIARFWEEGGDLEKLVHEGCDEDVWMLFGRLVADLSNESGGVPEIVGNTKLASRWLGDVLMPLL